MTQPVWDDERLDAAFHEKFGRSAPFDIERDVRARIAGTSPLRFPAIRHTSAGWALAAAAVVAVLVGTLTVGLGGFGRTAGSASPSPSASAASATPSVGATPTAQAIPGSVFGLPIIHVPDAIAIRDAGVDDREVRRRRLVHPRATRQLCEARPRRSSQARSSSAVQTS